MSVLRGGRSVFARRVFLHQVGTCRVQSKPRSGYFYMSPCGKQDLDFLFIMVAFISKAAGCQPIL